MQQYSSKKYYSDDIFCQTWSSFVMYLYITNPNIEFKSLVNWLIKFKETNDTSLPIFPEYMWPQWIISLIRNMLDDRIKIYDFVDCIELKMQDNNTHNNKWSKAPWNTFLKYWVTDAGEIKIENFIQNGLVHYTDVNWMSDADLTNLTNAFAK